MSNAQDLFVKPKGILAIDESLSTCTKRFDKLGIPCTEETRRQWRELIITTPHLSRYISGLIMVDETLRQSTSDGVLFTDYLDNIGIKCGIKVDEGLELIESGEQLTKGIDTLNQKLENVKDLKITFAKWRVVVNKFEHSYPTETWLTKTINDLVTYCATCIEQGITPIVEPEMIMTADPINTEELKRILEVIIDRFFAELSTTIYKPKDIIIKTGFVTSSTNITESELIIAGAQTAEFLEMVIPSDILGTVFLSGGFDSYQSITLLSSTINSWHGNFPLTFSFGRSIQQDALNKWSGDNANWHEAQILLNDRAKQMSNALV
jgi:fructose-bisphosphate aldolase, class I